MGLDGPRERGGSKSSSSSSSSSKSPSSTESTRSGGTVCLYMIGYPLEDDDDDSRLSVLQSKVELRELSTTKDRKLN